MLREAINSIQRVQRVCSFLPRHTRHLFPIPNPIQRVHHEAAGSDPPPRRRRQALPRARVPRSSKVTRYIPNTFSSFRRINTAAITILTRGN
ncbi:hypothetical protein Bca4012_013273 [Brassica carinata]